MKKNLVFLKKKGLCALLAAGITVSMFSGCGSLNQTASAGGTEVSSANGNTAEGNVSSAEESTAGPMISSEDLFGSDYAYTQESNVVDDEYRNFYEIFVYSYYDSDGDGIGDLNGVTEKLDYVSDLGFNGIWLMPIMSSPTYHKYDVIDYESVDDQYGTIEDFENLVSEAHDRGIRVIIDLPVNHTSSQCSWFTEACAYLEGLSDGETPDDTQCPYVDYYHFSQTQESNTWYQVGDSGWYYEGSFWSEMPDLDLSCQAVMSELEEAADFWISKGVDGFRMDAAMHFEENQTDFNTSVLNTLYTYCCQQDPDFYMVSEVWSGEPTIAEYYGSDTPSMFNFPLSGAEGCLIKAANGPGSSTDVVNAMINCQESYSEAYADYIDAPFLTNHDMARVSNALQGNEDAMKMAGGLLMTMSGSPFVYYGEEIGMASKGDADENKRLPMIWSLTDTCGMTNGPEDAATDVNQHFPGVDEQQADDTSILNYYRRALRLRNENPEIARGTITAIDSLCSGDSAAITKTWNDSTIGIVYNTSEEEITVDISGTDLEGMGICGYLTLTTDQTITMDGSSLTLPGRSICILK